jgi:hypothetical protein
MSAICIDCGVDTTPCTGKRGCRHTGRREYYMVRNRVWAEAGMRTGLVHPYSGGDYLCIGCIERRIGRKLQFADFTDVPVNDPDDPWKTRRLRSRLLRGLALASRSAAARWLWLEGRQDGRGIYLQVAIKAPQPQRPSRAYSSPRAL